MARFNQSQLNQYIDQQQQNKTAAINSITSKSDGGGNNTALIVRDALTQIAAIEADTVKEVARQSLSVNPALGTMYLEGSSEDGQGNPDKVFTIELLARGEVGGLVIDGEETGYKLIPIVTGNDTSIVWPAPSGFYVPSVPFDDTEEVFAGSGPTENMLGVVSTGSYSVIGSCKPDMNTGSQNNREIEVDLIVFDASGVPIRQLGFAQEANQSINGRSTSIVTGRLMLNDNFFTAGEFIGLAIRKGVNEGQTDATISKAFVQVSLDAIGA